MKGRRQDAARFGEFNGRENNWVSLKLSTCFVVLKN